MPRKITPMDGAELRAHVHAGKTLAEIGALCGVAAITVYVYVCVVEQAIHKNWYGSCIRTIRVLSWAKHIKIAQPHYFYFISEAKNISIQFICQFRNCIRRKWSA